MLRITDRHGLELTEEKLSLKVNKQPRNVRWWSWSNRIQELEASVIGRAEEKIDSRFQDFEGIF